MQIWLVGMATKFGDCISLPKMVANNISQFHRLVNTKLVVGFLVKWLANKSSPHWQIRLNLNGLLLADWKFQWFIMVYQTIIGVIFHVFILCYN